MTPQEENHSLKEDSIGILILKVAMFLLGMLVILTVSISIGVQIAYIIPRWILAIGFGFFGFCLSALIALGLIYGNLDRIANTKEE